MKKLTFVGNRTTPGGVRVAKLARIPVLAMAGAVGLLLLVTSGRYGYPATSCISWRLVGIWLGGMPTSRRHSPCWRT